MKEEGVPKQQIYRGHHVALGQICKENELCVTEVSSFSMMTLIIGELLTGHHNHGCLWKNMVL